MELALGDGAGVATLGPQLKLKKNVFQGVVVQVRDTETVPSVLKRVQSLPRLRKYEHFPYAVRVRMASTVHPTVLTQAAESDKKTTKLYRPTEEPGIVEDWEDDDEAGVGDRLLHVLQRWQVENVLLIVAREDASLSGRLIGHELYKLMAETAKLALEQYYVSKMKPSDAAKLEIFQEERGTAQYMVSPREEPTDNQSAKPSPRHRASVCLMTSDTVASWPQDHQPTSDGGGRKASKKGRVNHFMHDRRTSAATATSPNNNAADDTEPPLEEEPDSLLACGGVDWLNISRDEWLKLRTIRVPVKELHYLFMCLVVLVEKPIEKQSKAAPTSRQNEQFNAPSYTWNRCREVLQHTAQWSDRLRTFHGSALTKSQVTALRSVLHEPSVNDTAFVRICSASVKLFAWIQRLVDEYDEHELGIANAQLPGAEVVLQEEEAPPAPLVPQPPPSSSKPPVRKATKQSLSLNLGDESALARELNALAHATKNKIVDRGRLLSQKHLH